MQPFEYRSVSYWSKEINGTRTGGRKRNFFNSRPRAPYGLWRPRRLNPVNPRRRGLPGVAQGHNYTRANAYVVYATASSIFRPILSSLWPTKPPITWQWLPELSPPPRTAHAVQVTTHYQTCPERRPGADLPPKKVRNLGPMAPCSRQKRQLPEGPQ